MKRLNLIAIILIAIVCGCSKSKPVQKQVSEGTVILSPKHYDLGEIKSNSDDSIHKFKFEIENIGVDTIFLVNAEPGCQCVKIINYSKSIAPKEHGGVEGIINIAHQRGHLSKSIFLTQDNDEVIVLRVIGDIKK